MSTSPSPLHRAPTDLLSSLLADDAVPMSVLHERYGSQLELVRTLIGVVPNCDHYLEIWPPAFRTYNLMVPNLLNLPAALFGRGRAPADLVGLGMYVASRTAECPYCSAHTCSFALRRGAATAVVGSAFDEDDQAPEIRATVQLARALAATPTTLTVALRDQAVGVLGERGAEAVALGVVMMGFLNKFMDATGVPLEPSTYAEVTTTIGAGWDAGAAGWGMDGAVPSTPPPPADSMRTKLSVLPLAPGALKADRRWQRGMPRRWPAIGDHLRDLCGHDFPVLARLDDDRAARGIASMLRENLTPAQSVIGIDDKVLAGAVAAAVMGSPRVAADMDRLAAARGIDPTVVDDLRRWATEGGDLPPASSAASTAILRLALAVAPSPARVDERVVAEVRDAGLGAAAIVELVTWISVVQLLHRLSGYVWPADG